VEAGNYLIVEAQAAAAVEVLCKVGHRFLLLALSEQAVLVGRLVTMAVTEVLVAYHLLGSCAQLAVPVAPGLQPPAEPQAAAEVLQLLVE
jgi:hypothetical protein